MEGDSNVLSLQITLDGSLDQRQYLNLPLRKLNLQAQKQESCMNFTSVSKGCSSTTPSPDEFNRTADVNLQNELVNEIS